MENSASALTAGEEVAILPIGANSSSNVLEVSTITYIRSSTILLANGKIYARHHGRGLVTNDYIVAATDEHKFALAQKTAAETADSEPSAEALPA